MEGVLLAFAIIMPISCCIFGYRVFNNGKLPCIDTNVDRKNTTITIKEPVYFQMPTTQRILPNHDI